MTVHGRYVVTPRGTGFRIADDTWRELRAAGMLVDERGIWRLTDEAMRRFTVEELRDY